jgi:polar amino acid transport system substrate-binding protein
MRLWPINFSEDTTMNRLLTGIGSVLVFFVLTLPCQATAPRMSIAKLAGDVAPHLIAYEYPPLVTGDAAAPGAAVEIATQAFAAIGKPVTVEMFPSKNLALQLLGDDPKVIAMLGEARGLSAAERQALTEEKILNLTGKYFYYLPGGKDLAQVNDLKLLKGLTYGTIAEEATDSQTQAGIKVVNDEPKLLLRKLQAREIDFVSAFDPNGKWLIARLFPDEKNNFATMPLQAWESAFSLWFESGNAANKARQKDFSDGLKKIRQSGVYDAILKKYGLENAALK